MRAALRNPGEIRARLVPAVATLNPRHQYRPIGRDRESFKGVRDWTVLIDAERGLEAVATIQGPGQAQIRRKERAFGLRFARRPRDIDLAFWPDRHAGRLVQGIDLQTR